MTVTLNELNTVHIYLMDYAQEHARELTVEEMKLIHNMLRDIRIQVEMLIHKDVPTEELEREYNRKREARLARDLKRKLLLNMK